MASIERGAELCAKRRGPQPHKSDRPDCTQPTACVAKGKGHCRSCHMRGKNQDPEFRARNAAAVKANWKDPEFRAKQAAATQANWKDPEFRARNAAAVKANWKDPEFRAKQAAAVKANWKDPEFRARNAAAVKAAHGADAAEIHITLAGPFKRRAAAFATEYGCSRDIAEDALILIEDDGLAPQEAIAAARRYAKEAHRHG